MFKKRIGAHPHVGGSGSTGKVGCPDIWELESGDYAVIGIDRTTDLAPYLPSDASCGPDERIVVVDRRIFVGAKRNLPSK